MIFRVVVSSVNPCLFHLRLVAFPEVRHEGARVLFLAGEMRECRGRVLRFPAILSALPPRIGPLPKFLQIWPDSRYQSDLFGFLFFLFRGWGSYWPWIATSDRATPKLNCYQTTPLANVLGLYEDPISASLISLIGVSMTRFRKSAVIRYSLAPILKMRLNSESSAS